MSYQAQGAISYDADKRPGSVPDFSRLKMRLKDDAIRALGAVNVGGQNYPKISYNEGLALIVYWRTIGQTTAKEMQKSLGVWGDALTRVDAVYKAVDRFNIKAMSWMGRWLVPDPMNPTTLNPLAIQALWSDVLGHYVIELDNSTWSGFNIQAPSSIAWEAAKESTLQVGKAVSKPFLEVLEAASTAWTITKLVTYGGIIALGVWGVSLVMKRGKNA